MPFTPTRRQVETYYYDEPIAADVWPLRMMQIPAGSFTMGSPKDELERTEAEGPQHKVTLDRFFMAKYPVTQAQWLAVAAMDPVNQKLESDPLEFKGEHHPVERVSWYDAVEFCDRITLHTNRQYRLPTEAEWEYACRAGTTTPFHFGKTLTTELANYDGNYTYDDGPKGKYRNKTTPVNHFEGANPFGLCDMHGNVYEWCQDQWHKNYKSAPIDGSAWEDREKDASRILRGGSWGINPRNCRSAYRVDLNPDDRDYAFGFRVVCSAPRILP